MRQLNDILNGYKEFNLWNQSIVLAYRGSIAHGTFIPSNSPDSIDDRDILGIAMPSKEYFFGLKTFEQFEKFEGEWDVLIYDFRKAVRLLMNSNPNILQILWTPEKHLLRRTPIFDQLVKHRNLFVSKGLYKSFGGYSYGQLKKMEHMTYHGYMGEKRKKLVDKFGYDTKNAQHLIRLLRQGIEFLKTGELVIERPDAEELKQIKLGMWSIHKVKHEAAQLFEKMKQAFENSSLPDTCDVTEINRLVVEITCDYYCKRDFDEYIIEQRNIGAELMAQKILARLQNPDNGRFGSETANKIIDTYGPLLVRKE